MGPKGAVVIAVDPDGPAAAAGLLPGDELLTVNGKRPADLMDVLDQANWGALALRVKRGEEIFESVLDKSEDEPLGLDFADTLFDRVKTCRNKCVFCFMDQMPKFMRPSLYYRDDDFRLSALHGNFITLTNLSQEEWDRIERQRVSPLYVSVHATDPEVRDNLLGNTVRSKMDILGTLEKLIDWGIQVHTQIVLCPGLNDGEILDKSMRELSALYPGVETVSVVPVGLTRFRAHLPHLRLVTKEMVPGLIEQVGRFQRENLKKYHHPICYLADEMYLIADLPQPPASHYLDFPQIENGVGLVRRFLMDFGRRKRFLKPLPTPLNWLMVTGEYGLKIFPPLIDEIHRRTNVRIELVAVPNDFFGHSVKCAGLLSGRDILKTLEAHRAFLRQPNTRVLIPSAALKDAAVFNPGRTEARELFLDDVPMQALADHFQVPFVVGGTYCPDWLDNLFGKVPWEQLTPQDPPMPIEIIDFPEHVARGAVDGTSCRTP